MRAADLVDAGEALRFGWSRSRLQIRHRQKGRGDAGTAVMNASPQSHDMVRPPLKVYRCKGKLSNGEVCRKVLFEAVKVDRLTKICPRCKAVNVYSE